ncbi:DUF1801 domain-containing protein [Aliiroseovarius sp. YM-037]|uniref:DUF1801 domain-containing protein n=1 Tax=Aliiroseovarius sp. YM-037 TaxID=3341728 RepID=UPI003A7FF578
MKLDIERWLAELFESQREIAVELRKLGLLHGQDLREELRWNQPSFYKKINDLQHPESQRAGFSWLRRRTVLADPDGFLVGRDGQMRHVKVPLQEVMNRDALAKFLREAVKLDMNV